MYLYTMVTVAAFLFAFLFALALASALRVFVRFVFRVWSEFRRK